MSVIDDLKKVVDDVAVELNLKQTDENSPKEKVKKAAKIAAPIVAIAGVIGGVLVALKIKKDRK